MSEHIVRPGQSWTQVSHLRCLIAMDFDNGTVTFRIDHIPLHRIAVQFEWAELFGELQKNQKISHLGGMSVFAQKKMCAFQRSSGLVVIRRVARLSCIGARLMFGPLGHATASIQAHRGPTGPRQPPGGPQAALSSFFSEAAPGLGGPQLRLA